MLLSGHRTHATVVSARQCSRSTAGGVTLTFIDLYGHRRTEDHTFLMFACDASLHPGDEMTIEYVPDRPGILLTQSEINDLPVSFIFFGICDVLFIGGGAIAVYFLALQPLIARLRPPMRAG